MIYALSIKASGTTQQQHSVNLPLESSSVFVVLEKCWTFEKCCPFRDPAELKLQIS